MENGAVVIWFVLCIKRYSRYKEFYKRPVDKQHWLFTLGGRMGGAFVATLTAFTVVSINLGSNGWILWMLPGLLTGAWITKILRRYKKKAYASSTRLGVG